MIQYVSQWAGRKSGLANTLLELVYTFSHHGVAAIELPPTRQTLWAGPDSPSLGYDPMRDYDWGNCGLATRVGSQTEIQNLSRLAHYFGMRLTGDFVDRQYGGKPPYVELTAQGKPDHTLFLKNPVLFEAEPDSQFDPEKVPSDGTLACYEHSTPKGYMLREKCKADRAMCDALGLDGGRQDEAKSMSPAALHALLAARPGGWNVAEVYTGDTAELDRFWREFDTPVLDFPYHYACRDVSSGAGFGRLVGSAYADQNPEGAYRYVESLDTDGPNGVLWNKLWFYLHGMTTPCRVMRLYAGDAEGYGLLPVLLNYAWISARLAFGKLAYTIVEDDLLCWTRDGDGGRYGQSAGLVCGISKDPINTQWRWTWTPFGPHKQLHNYAVSGGPDVWTNADGWACLPFGPNYFGGAQNGFAYSLAGQDGPVHLPALPDVVKGWTR